jgi:hypothetical protein
MKKKASSLEPTAASVRAIPEFDFRHGVRGKYAKRFHNVFVLDADLMAAFPDSESINAALRAVVMKRDATEPTRVRPKRRPTRR